MILKFIKSSYSSIKNALTKTSSLLGNKIRSILGKGQLDEDTLDQLEQALYEADLGVETTRDLIKKINMLHAQNPKLTPEEYIDHIKNELITILSEQSSEIASSSGTEPTVLLIVGVNGNGKTTAVAKMAKRLKDQGKKVLVAAGDTFRAAAIDQLDIWAQRIGVEIIKSQPKSDPSAVVFDAISAAKSRGMDVVLIDTAGRLHTKTPLMQELEKIRRTCNKSLPGSPHETLLVIDATTGQNGLDQARTFQKYTPLTGLILTKLDGTAKGGLVVNLQRQLKIPVKFIGIGEGADDLAPFDAESFVKALFE